MALGISANDPEDDPLQYSASGLPPGLLIGITSGLISSQIGASGTCQPTITVNDGQGGTDSIMFTWTITASAAPRVPITVGSTENGRYGNGYGPNGHRYVLVAIFSGTSKSLKLNLVGYDVDFNNEVAVFLNDQFQANLSRGPNQGSNTGNQFSIIAAQQRNGENRIEIRQCVSGWIWGVTGLSLEP